MSRPLRLPRALICCLALFAAACGADPQSALGDRGPLALSALETSELAEPVQLVVAHTPSEEALKGWSYKAADVSLAASAHGGSLSLKPTEFRFAVGIPGAVRQGTVNQVVVHLTLVAPTDVYVLFKAKGRVQFRSEAIRQPTTRTPAPLLLDVSGALSLEEPSDEIEVVFGNRKNPVQLYGVELAWVPPELVFPMASSTPSSGGLIDLDGEYRMALCLRPDQVVTGRALVPSEAELRFGFGLPRKARFPSVGGHLKVTLSAEGAGPVTESFDVGGDWEDHKLDLSAFAGSETTFEFVFANEGAARALLALATPRLICPTPTPRHVILVTSDTHRGDHLGAASEGVDIRTPFLDSLAAEGVFFEDCLSTTNITVPSHAAVMTGISPREAGMTDNMTALSAEARTLAEHFREAGYYTASVLSTKHLSHENSGLGQGFERVITTSREKQDGATSLDAVRRLLDEEGDHPAFLWLHVFDAHAPYLPPDEYRNEYYPEDRDPYKEGTGITDGNRAVWDPRIRDLEFVLSQYRSEITYLDATLSELFSEPRFDDSIFAFTADHGESLGGHGVFFKHSGVYSDTIDVPLIMRWPGCPTGARVSAPVQNIDLGRTLLDLAGMGEVEFPGESLVDAIDGARASAPRFVLGSHAHAAAVEQDGWLCVLNLQSKGVPGAVRHRVELYNLRTDPDCSHDQVDDEFERARQMRGGLIAWLNAERRADLTISRAQHSVELLEAITALGYTTESDSGEGPYYEEDPDDEWCKRFR